MPAFPGEHSSFVSSVRHTSNRNGKTMYRTPSMAFLVVVILERIPDVHNNQQCILRICLILSLPFTISPLSENAPSTHALYHFLTLALFSFHARHLVIMLEGLHKDRQVKPISINSRRTFHTLHSQLSLALHAQSY